MSVIGSMSKTPPCIRRGQGELAYPSRFLISSSCFLSRSGSRLPKSLKWLSMSGISAFHSLRSMFMSAFMFVAGTSRPGEIEVSVLRHEADGRLLRADLPVHSLAHPLEHAAVVAETRPEEPALSALPEPVHVENAGRLRSERVAHGEPVGEIVAHVIAAEGLHGKGIAPEVAHSADVGGSGLRSCGCSHEHAVVPVNRPRSRAAPRWTSCRRR